MFLGPFLAQAANAGDHKAGAVPGPAIKLKNSKTNETPIKTEPETPPKLERKKPGPVDRWQQLEDQLRHATELFDKQDEEAAAGPRSLGQPFRGVSL